MKVKQLLTIQWTPQRLVFAAAAGVFLLLAALPATRWLVRWQSIPGFYAQTATSRWQEANLTEAAEHPDDYAMQLAATLQGQPASTPRSPDASRNTAERLWELRTRFPNEPSLYAAVLVHLTQSAVRTGRPLEQDLLSAPEVRVKNAAQRAEHPDAPPEPAAIRLFLQAAESGERLDPENGFFPMMRAIALFNQNEDAAALQSLHRAAQMPQWNDYAFAETLAGDKLTFAAHGETGTLARTSRAAATLFPHFAQLRALSRVAMGLAIAKELAGDTAGGWAIRKDIAQCGAVMRREAPSYIGSLVGGAISQMAMARPGGAEALTADARTTGDERAQQRFERFQAYAGKVGRGEDMPLFRIQKIETDQIKAIFRAGEDKSLFGMGRLAKIIGLWGIGSALVSNAIIVLILGGIAFALARTPRIRRGEPLHLAIRWGFGVLITPLPTAITAGVLGGTEGALTGFGLGLIGVSLVAVLDMVRRTDRRRSLGIFALSVPAILGGFALLALGTYPTFQMIQASGSIIGLLSFDGSSHTRETLLYLGLVGVAALSPVLWLGSLAIRSWFRRVPVSVGIVRGAAGGALGFSSLLLFTYAVVALLTLRIEAQGIQDLQEMTRHEGRYYARMAGKTWPGDSAAH